MEKGLFKMLGRKNVDIIKCGGYKLSALEIETNLLANPNIAEVAVFGVPDDTFGEAVCAVVVPKKDAMEDLTLESLKTWAKDVLPEYSLPSQLHVVPLIDKNSMGKVNKKELRNKIFTQN